MKFSKNRFPGINSKNDANKNRFPGINCKNRFPGINCKNDANKNALHRTDEKFNYIHTIRKYLFKAVANFLFK